MSVLWDGQATGLRGNRRNRRTVDSNFPRYEDWQSGRNHYYEKSCCLPVRDNEEDSQFLQYAAYHSTRRHKPQYSTLHIHRCEQFKLQRQKGRSELMATQYLILQPAILGTSSFRFTGRFDNTGKSRVLAVSPTEWKRSAPARRIFMKFAIWGLLEKPSRKSRFR